MIFFFSNILHFRILGSHLAQPVFTSALWPRCKAEKLWMVFKPNLLKGRVPNSKNVNFSYHVSCAVNAYDKSVGVSLSKWLWKFARPCQQQFPSAAKSPGRVNAGVWDWDWGEQHARRTLFLPSSSSPSAPPPVERSWQNVLPSSVPPGRAAPPMIHTSPYFTPPKWAQLRSPYFSSYFTPFYPFVLCVFTVLHPNAKCVLGCWFPQIFGGLQTFYNPTGTRRSTL